MSKLDSVKTFVEGASGFLERCPPMGAVAQTFGALTFGAMRAIAECPNCPGKFRVPYDAEYQLAWPIGKGNWTYLVCRSCQQVWTLQEEATP